MGAEVGACRAVAQPAAAAVERVEVAALYDMTIGHPSEPREIGYGEIVELPIAEAAAWIKAGWAKLV